jgi:BirA family biotin operon repressor/biotin-[acetyl-CoA-carboxylase] ligase
MLLEEGQSPAVIVGIGLNCHNREFPPEVAELATSLDLEADQQGRAILLMTRAELLAQILRVIENRWPEFACPPALAQPGAQPAWLDDYRALCATLGQVVRVISFQGDVREGQAVGLSDGGDLLVRWPDGTGEAVSAGEVSVRGLLGWA